MDRKRKNKMKWKTAFVFVLVMLAVASMAVTNVFGQNITVDELWNNTQVAIRNVTTVKYDPDTIDLLRNNLTKP